MISKLILIGASTGGPGHLKKILESLPADFTTPVIIAQHMNRVFIPTFVSQFDNSIELSVNEVKSNMKIENKHIYVCRKSSFIEKEDYFFRFVETNEESLYNPCIDILFKSVLPFVEKIKVLAVLLTGIGEDGAFGLSELQKHGALCFAESKESAVVYGMPKKAVELNPDIRPLSLSRIVEEIRDFGDRF